MADRGEVTTARALLQAAIGRRIFPAAVAEVGCGRGPLWQEAFGRMTFDDAAPPATVDTIFDLASMTKPLATTTVVLDLLDRGRLTLEFPVGRFLPEWRGADRESVTVRDLLEHASGLSARLPFLEPLSGNKLHRAEGKARAVEEFFDLAARKEADMIVIQKPG